MKINKVDLENILYGACFLASGGGGTIESGQKCIDKSSFKNEDDFIEVIDYCDIKDNEWIIPSSGMGDPSADFDSSDLNMSMFNVIRLIEKWCKENINEFKNFKYILPMEVGTINSILPIIAAKIAKDKGIDIKVVNADPSGRATPTLPLTLFSGYNCDIVPNFIASGADVKLNKIPYATFNLNDINTLQSSFEPLFTSSEFGYCSSFSLYPKSKKELKPKFLVQYTMEDALNIGKILNEKKNDTPLKRVNEIISYMNNQSKEKRETKKAFYGTLTAIEINSQNGHDIGNFIIEGKKEFKGKKLKIATANENIYANIITTDKSGQTKEETLITGPDSISLIPKFSNTKIQEENAIKILDVTDLEAWFNCPIKNNKIDLYVISIEASKNVRKCDNLIDIWNQFSKSLGGFGNYPKIK
jgi:hypothetical protein